MLDSSGSSAAESSAVDSSLEDVSSEAFDSSSAFAAAEDVVLLSDLSSLSSSELPQAAIEVHILSASANASIDLIFFMCFPPFFIYCSKEHKKGTAHPNLSGILHL